MENVGFDPERVHFNVHTQGNSTAPGSVASHNMIVPKLWDNFHTYGLDWLPDRLDFYFDGKKVMTYLNDHKGVSAWPFDEPQFVILNLAIGGDWGGQKGVDDSIFPSKFLVDYVRVYKSR
jgi:beta-glucanase (GH16 family)